MRFVGNLCGTHTSPLPQICSNREAGITAEVYAARRW